MKASIKSQEHSQPRRPILGQPEKFGTWSVYNACVAADDSIISPVAAIISNDHRA